MTILIISNQNSFNTSLCRHFTPTCLQSQFWDISEASRSSLFRMMLGNGRLKMLNIPTQANVSLRMLWRHQFVVEMGMTKKQIVKFNEYCWYSERQPAPHEYEGVNISLFLFIPIFCPSEKTKRMNCHGWAICGWWTATNCHFGGVSPSLVCTWQNVTEL